jgi:eukaryotic-like serine/threonine-protein kinase
MSGIPAGAGSLLGKRLGKYEILALLALGGTAEIYLARIGGAAGFEKYVVVKCLHDHLADDAEFVKMFLDEARLAAHLDHSNIVQTMELGEHEHRYYMVMEFLAGLSLAMMVRRAGERLPGGKIPVPLVLNMIAQACAGLHYAHERTVNGKPLNVVHRDISPQNLVVSFEGVVKLVDFGIAKAELRETRTQSGTIKGKFAYMSPEQCVANNVDRRTDVFALGVIAHELLTGRRLFKKASPYETYQAVIECAVEPPSRVNPELDPALDPLIMRAVAKDKLQRYATAEELGDALAGYLHQRGISSGPGDVSRFFESSFAMEIEEHGARMRELISGRAAADPAATWAAEDEEAKAGIDLASGSGVRLSGGSAAPPASGSLSDVLGGLDLPATGDDDMPAERTRIETNPLERVNELDAMAGQPKQPPAPQPAMPPPAMPPPGPLPLPAAPPGKPPKPATGPSPLARPSGQKFPAAANLPTMIAEPDEDDDAGELPELAKTELGAPVHPPDPPAPASPAQADPNARTVLDMAAPNLDQLREQLRASGAQPPAQPPRASEQGPQAQPPREARGSQPPPNQPMPPHMPRGPNMPPISPGGYPVMDAQMRDQLASGATVFPSGRGSSGTHDAAAPPMGAYPGQGDWSAAGGPPVRTMPPWMLAVLFVGALGGALLITILIAMAVR